MHSVFSWADDAMSNALREGSGSDAMALIALSAGSTAAKVGDVKGRVGRFGFVTACRCCKTFPFTYHIWTAMTLQGQHRKSVVIGVFF